MIHADVIYQWGRWLTETNAVDTDDAGTWNTGGGGSVTDLLMATPHIGLIVSGKQPTTIMDDASDSEPWYASGINDTSYVRKAVSGASAWTWGTAFSSPGTSAGLVNNTTFTFEEATTDWTGDIVGWALYGAAGSEATSATYYWKTYFAFGGGAVSVSSGVTPRIGTATITMTFA